MAEPAHPDAAWQVFQSAPLTGSACSLGGWCTGRPGTWDRLRQHKEARITCVVNISQVHKLISAWQHVDPAGYARQIFRNRLTCVHLPHLVAPVLPEVVVSLGQASHLGDPSMVLYVSTGHLTHLAFTPPAEVWPALQYSADKVEGCGRCRGIRCGTAGAIQ
jgi:hypothetical protein